MVCLEDAHKMSLTAQKWETYRFTSKEFDRETGLYYFGARYYEPKLSNWMSADPAGFDLINPMDSDGKPRSGYLVIEATNWYSYVSNNPVKYVDPTGEIATVAAGALIGGAVGAVAGAASAVAQGNTSPRKIVGSAAGGAISGATAGALFGSGVGAVALLAGSGAGGAAGSVAENLITGDAKTLGLGGVAKDAAIDGGISAVASAVAAGFGKLLGSLVDDAWSAVGKATKKMGGSWGKAFMKAFGIEKKARVAKPVIEGGIGFLNDIAQDQTGPTPQDQQNPADENQNKLNPSDENQN